MVPVVSLILLALAVSLDGFGVGVTYGLRKIKIPLLSILIIAICSGLMMLVSMVLGSLMSTLFQPIYAKVIGSILLISIGVWAIYQMVTQSNDNDPEEETINLNTPRTLLYIEIKKLGIVIEILRTPSKADIDRSGNISSSEAALLGTALSLDALGAGIGAGLLGLSPWLTALCISISCGVFLIAGLKVGYIYSSHTWVKRLSFIPGAILIMMGLFKLF